MASRDFPLCPNRGFPWLAVASRCNLLIGVSAGVILNVLLFFVSTQNAFSIQSTYRPTLHGIEYEISKERRKQRDFLTQNAAVASTFLRLRAAEEEENRAKEMRRAEAREGKRRFLEIKAQHEKAMAELKRTKLAVKERESVLAARHAFKTFTLDVLGADTPNAGGAKARNKRFEVLDRLAQLKAGLSAGQRNDWAWFKQAWDEKMASEHKGDWAKTFMAWIQHVLNDERSNAFSVFVYNETHRVLSPGTVALFVPGR